MSAGARPGFSMTDLGRELLMFWSFPIPELPPFTFLEDLPLARADYQSTMSSKIDVAAQALFIVDRLRLCLWAIACIDHVTYLDIHIIGYSRSLLTYCDEFQCVKFANKPSFFPSRMCLRRRQDSKVRQNGALAGFDLVVWGRLDRIMYDIAVRSGIGDFMAMGSVICLLLVRSTVRSNILTDDH